MHLYSPEGLPSRVVSAPRHSVKQASHYTSLIVWFASRLSVFYSRPQPFFFFLPLLPYSTGSRISAVPPTVTIAVTILGSFSFVVHSHASSFTPCACICTPVELESTVQYVDLPFLVTISSPIRELRLAIIDRCGMTHRDNRPLLASTPIIPGQGIRDIGLHSRLYIHTVCFFPLPDWGAGFDYLERADAWTVVEEDESNAKFGLLSCDDRLCKP